MSIFFFFNDTATTEIYTLSLHDALPISASASSLTPVGWRSPVLVTEMQAKAGLRLVREIPLPGPANRDRKSTRLNSSHSQISYAVFCLKKKKGTLYVATAIPE